MNFYLPKKLRKKRKTQSKLGKILATSIGAMYHESIYLERDAVQTDKFHLINVPNQLKQKLQKKLTSRSTILWGTENKMKYKKCYYIVQI